jgi:hypothetical protein
MNEGIVSAISVFPSGIFYLLFHIEQYFTCQTKLQQTMLWACVRYSSWQDV